MHVARANAWCRTTTQRASIPGECSNRGIPLQWQSACASFSLFAEGSPDVSIDDLRTVAAAAAARWHRAACDTAAATQPYFELLPFPDTTTGSGYDPQGPNANTVSFNSTWRSDAFHRVDTIAITLVTFDAFSGAILDADVELNELSADNPNGFHFTIGTPDTSSADLPTILTHEFGHFHGLGHTVIDTAVMWPEAGLGEQRRNLRSDDAVGICDAYPPGSAPDLACNPVPYGGFASSPGAGRVHGGCNAGHGARGFASIAGGMGMLALMRRRRRAA